ncbi:MAG: NFACT family protein [Thermoplasmata archaeon]|nr:NFACT family protein [Thermoplasmata archaeon]
MTEAPAKDRFTGLDTLALARELRALPRPRIDKVFDGPSGAIDLSFRVPGLGRRALRLVPGRFGALLSEEEAHAEEPSPFVRELRRLLSGAVLTSVREPEGERLLELESRRGDVEEPLRIAVELFGSGNLVVVRGETVVAVLHPRAWAHRTLRIGSPYRTPPERANPWRLGVAELTAALLASRTDRVTTLAARLSLGGPVAEELLARSGLPGDRPATEEAGVAAVALESAIRGLLSEVGEPPSGYLYRHGPLLVDVEPFRSRRWSAVEGVEEEQHSTFSEAALRFFSGLGEPAAPPTSEQLRRSELRRQREQQESAIAALHEEAQRLLRQAETILARHPDVVRKLAELPPGEDGAPAEIELDGIRLPLKYGRAPRESAQLLFEERKRVLSKLDGARAALGSTEGELQENSPGAPSLAPGPPRATKDAPLWFEKYRWFLSSEGVVSIAGRDAPSNDRIVKRYLGPRDRYIHADVHGAASVVVKHPESSAVPIGEATLREAGQWGVAFSKYWRAGRASGDAFWVEAEQVSKAGSSGEFVARGAWVIHGTKHIMKDLPVELALGRVSVEGRERWSVAPPAAIRAQGKVEYLLRPGEERDRAQVEKTLARELSLNRSVLQALLPAGGIAIERPT